METGLDAQQAHHELQATVDRLLAGKESLRVLDAGCGSAAHVRFPESARMVGIDLSQRQLDRNVSLHEKILGDLQTYPLPPESFDAIVCWDVLEHLDAPDAALRRFFTAVKPGGVVVLACPDPWSLKGLVTRFSPHWFHLWFYRHVRKSKKAGTQDFGPFPTVMSPRIAPAAIASLAAAQGMTVEFGARFVGFKSGRKGLTARRAVELSLQGLSAVLRLVTFGHYRGELSETMLVLKKPAASSPSPTPSHT
jgi:SAM-dependent methyltransferase